MSVSLEPTSIRESNTLLNAESLPVSKQDLEAEARIRDALSLRNKDHRQISYSYNHQPHEITIHFSEDKIGDVTPPLFIILVKEEMPKQLQKHLIGLIQKKLRGKAQFSFASVPDFHKANWYSETIIAGVKLEDRAFLHWRFAHDPFFFPFPWPKSANECLSSAEFARECFQQNYLNKFYHIVVIHNPKKQPLMAKGINTPIDSSFLIVSDHPLPPHFKEHIINNWIPTRLKNQISDHVFLDGNAPFEFDALNNYLEPVIITAVGNSSDQAKVQECFKSNKLAQQVFLCKMNNQEYRVRVFNNPQQKDLSKEFYSKDKKIDWKSKYIIITDKEAPEKVLHHFLDALPPEQRNQCKILNGTMYESYFDVWALANSGNMIVT